MENDCLIVMGDLPRWKMMVLLWWVTYPDVSEKVFRKGSEYIKIFTKSHYKDFRKNPCFFLGNSLNIGWPARFKIFIKTPCFFFKMVSISSDLPVLNFKRNHLTSRNKVVVVHFLFHNSVDLRFCTSAVPKTLELFCLSSHLSCPVSVMTI
jgi:hypothetical protein